MKFDLRLMNFSSWLKMLILVFEFRLLSDWYPFNIIDLNQSFGSFQRISVLVLNAVWNPTLDQSIVEVDWRRWFEFGASSLEPLRTPRHGALWTDYKIRTHLESWEQCWHYSLRKCCKHCSGNCHHPQSWGWWFPVPGRTCLCLTESWSFWPENCQQWPCCLGTTWSQDLD